jgi:hypothetical protein
VDGGGDEKLQRTAACATIHIFSAATRTVAWAVSSVCFMCQEETILSVLYNIHSFIDLIINFTYKYVPKESLKL